LYYLETIVPILNKITSAYKRFFGFDVYEDISYIDAMRPELSDQATYLNSLVNAGIMTRNEARDQLGLKAMSGHDELVIPQNIAGSAVDSSQGGAPKKKDPAE
jgi:phage portal protein BeeE